MSGNISGRIDAETPAQRGSDPFHIRTVKADPMTGRIELTYAFANGPSFIERIQLPGLDGDGPDEFDTAGFAAAAKLLLLVAGTSYFKSQAPETVVVEVPTTPAERALVQQLFDHGMREFAYVNQLPIPLVTDVQWQGGEAPIRAAQTDDETKSVGRPLVPFGGGKDSTVVLSLLPEATPVTVNPTSTHWSVAAVLGHDLLTVDRRLDNLDELTRPDRLNGHIPITAIVSTITVALAVRDGFTSVVLANEEAASEPTLISTRPESEGRAVNHQWSKGGTFEALLDRALIEAGIGVRYFSWLRSVPEPDIIALLSAEDTALDVIVSCNRAFAGRTAGQADEAEQRWCGACPKCVFTYLMLATRLPPDRLHGIFGADLLDMPDREADFAELWSSTKPLECVGERTDAASALLAVAKDPQWADHQLVPALVPSARAGLQDGAWDSIRNDDAGLIPRPVPEAFEERLRAALAPAPESPA